MDKWREELETVATEFCEFLRARGIACEKSDGGEYFVDIKTDHTFKLYTNRKGERRITLPLEMPEKRRLSYINLWEEFNGRVRPGINIYVDGSYKDGTASYAAVVLDGGVVLDKISGCFPDDDGFRNIAGEIKALEKSLEYCIEKGIGEVAIHYDFQGLKDWVVGTWQSNNPLTRAYRDFVLKASEEVKINWIKLKAHSGDSYNELVDKLAKKALSDC